MPDPSPNLVAVSRDLSAGYPSAAPFDPAEGIPEYSGPIAEANSVYPLVRDCLYQLGFDAERFGTVDWNPLGHLVRPGQVVLIKPNLVLDRHPRGGDLECLVTHGSVVRAVLDYVLIALKGEGHVVIGDSPLQGTDFARAAEAAGLTELVAAMKPRTQVDLQLVDFRQVVAEMDERFHVRSWTEQPGDPRGYEEFDLANDSMLAPIAKDSHMFRVSNYKAEDTLQYHNEKSHRYVVAGTVLDADLIIDMPKMKTHCKAGVTLALKNFVGTIGRKQCLAHHRHGGHLEGGDEYPERSRLKRLSERLERMIDGNSNPGVRKGVALAYRVNERIIRELGINGIRDGCWHGNDTVWRMVIDLVRIARYGQRGGELAENAQRPILTIMDGIVAGENEGPLEATPLQAGMIIGGLDPVAVDVATATIMGYDPTRIPLLKGAEEATRWPLSAVTSSDIRVAHEGCQHVLSDLAAAGLITPFVPAVGWIGHVEAARPKPHKTGME